METLHQNGQTEVMVFVSHQTETSYFFDFLDKEPYGLCKSLLEEFDYSSDIHDKCDVLITNPGGTGSMILSILIRIQSLRTYIKYARKFCIRIGRAKEIDISFIHFCRHILSQAVGIVTTDDSTKLLTYCFALKHDK